METKTLIQSQANVLRITSLKKGDVIKRVESGGYSSGEVRFCIVTDLLNNGAHQFIEMLEYTKSYSGITSEIKLYDGSKDLAIFPATVEEVEEHLGSSIKSLERTIKEKKEELGKLETGLKNAKEFVSGERSKRLTATSYVEITQADFEKEKKEKEAKLLELQNN